MQTTKRISFFSVFSVVNREVSSWELGVRIKKQTKIGCAGWLSALSVLCVRIICWVGSGFKQQKSLCLVYYWRGTGWALCPLCFKGGKGL